MITNWLSSWVRDRHDELVDVRRHLHAHPELSFDEYATTELLVKRLTAARLAPRILPRGTGVVVDIGDGPRTIGLRADIDALPVSDLTDTPYTSTVPGVCHACGHDAHAAIGLGAALALAEAPNLAGRVRIFFQPAEERMGGAREVIAAGELDDVSQVFALHCDAHLEVGKVGIKSGAITAACDLVDVRLRGPGGHTARPHLTVDIVDALARIATDTPRLLSRRVDARSAMTLVWGAISAGKAPNTIPSEGSLRGTVRVLDHETWAQAEKEVTAIVSEIATSAGASVDLHYDRGVPPVVNDPELAATMRAAVATELGSDAVTTTRTSMGGEDFAWYGEHVPVMMARLGTHSEALSTVRDLHQGTFDIDERAIDLGVRILVSTALVALSGLE